MSTWIEKIIKSHRVPISLLFIIISGVLSGVFMTFPTVTGAVLEWVALVPALCACLSYSLNDEFKYRHVYWGGFLFFMTEYAVCYHWFWSMFPLEFTGMGKGAALCVVLLGWLGLSALASLAGSFSVLLFFFIYKKLQLSKRPVTASALGAAFYAIFEWVETLGWTGVPWGRLGMTQLTGTVSPTLMSSAVFGPYFTTFLIVFVNFLIASVLFCDKKKTLSIAAVSTACINLIGGFSCLFLYSLDEPVSVKVAAVQGNFNSGEKWESNNIRKASDVYLNLTEQAADEGAELVLWTETAITYDTAGTTLESKIKNSCLENNIYTIVGCFEKKDESVGNVLKFYRPDGSVSDNSYFKRHLVPFGEYVPYRNLIMTLIPPLGELSMLEKDLYQGSDTCVQDTGKYKYGSLICFDSIYEELCRNTCREGADIVLLSTNDSWFGTSAALTMHLNQSRLRAIENGVTVVRAANTGITAIIDRTGRITSFLQAETEDVLISDCDIYGSNTPYTFFGNFFVYLCLLFVLIFFFFSFALCIKKKKRVKD